MPLTLYSGKITKIHALTPTVRGIDVQLDNNQTIPFKTGQWLNFHLTHNGTIIKRAFSIASPSYQNSLLHFCVKRIENGIGSNILFTFEEGDSFTMSGPFGHFTLKPTTRDIVFIATGSGVAPFRAMLLELIHHQAKNNITLLFGNRTEEEIIYKKEFEQIARDHPNFTFIPILSRSSDTWKEATGHVQDHIKERFTNVEKNHDFYICGLKEMVFNVKELLESLGFPKENIYFERYN